MGGGGWWGVKEREGEKEREGKREGERERLDSLWNHFPFFKDIFSFLHFWDVSHYHVGATVGRQILDGEDRMENCT